MILKISFVILLPFIVFNVLARFSLRPCALGLWTVCGLIVWGVWYIHFNRDGTADPLAHMMDRVFMSVTTAAWLMGLLAMYARHVASCLGFTHGSNLLIHGLGTVALLIVFAAGFSR